MDRRILFILISLGGTLLAACGGSAASTPTPGEPVDVHINLTEFKIDSDLKNFRKGVTYRFIVTNKGSVAHELAILPTGAQHDMSSMPGMSQDTQGMSDDADLIHIAQNELPPGGTKQVQVVFQEDTRGRLLEMACHVPGHYEAGMKLGIGVN